MSGQEIHRAETMLRSANASYIVLQRLDSLSSAGGAATRPSSVKTMSSWGSLAMGSAASSPSPFSYHKGG
jgi:hypothetical protein